MTAPDAAARRKSRRIAWAVRLGSLVLRLLAVTWRIREVDAERLRGPMRRGEGLVPVFWHGHILPMLWWHRHRGIAVLISEHGDGEIIARIARSLGYDLVRGSTSRGGQRALLESIRLASSGTTLAITPDGPRGPARTFAPGALLVSHKAGVPILPLSVRATRAWTLKSWDSFLIPKPFARLTIAYGEPVRIDAATPREAAGQADRLQHILDALGDSIGA